MMTATVPNIDTLTITNIGEGLTSGAFTAEALTRACLARVE